MTTASQAQTLREIQAGVASLIRGELDGFFGSLNLDKPDKVRDALLQFVPLLVRRYGQGAASVAADWYDEVRAGANVRTRFRAQVADPVAADRVERAVRFAAGHLFTATPALALPAILAPAARYTAEPARLTITQSVEADPDAYGWSRRVRAGACRFCRALEQRGRTYRRSTADFAAHNDCGCVAVPNWNSKAPEVPAVAYLASARTGGMSARAKAAHNAKIRGWLDSEFPPDEHEH
ncbi:VG15 protein [Microbacterium sp. 11MF]|uniref:VG15 protein n=1 Tax=Microbacterium sp. 11MF TaxID=1169146 RepID=UPI00048E44E2|nr:hypothetical protein [Microbacterium sp. 11MF]